MAKNKMQVKYKQPKRVRNKSKEIETDNKLMSAVKTVLGVLIAMVLMYLMMFVMEKLGVFEAGYTKPDSGETTISNEYIMVGEILNRSENNYYVLFDNYSSNFTSDIYINNLLASSETRTYKVDMSKDGNSKYMSEDENRDASSINDLKINGLSLIRVNNGRIVEYKSGSDEIEEYLK